MPVIKLRQLTQQSGWAVWFISETKDELIHLVHESLPADIIHLQKQQEWLAGRALIQALTSELGVPYAGLRKDESGKPFPQGYDYHLSLSHSFPYVAVQVDKGSAVGVDLEQPKDKLLKIASRILSSQELEDAGTDIVKHCVYWCAKEAMYKIYGKRGLHFMHHLNVAPFVLAQEGSLQGLISSEDGKQHVTLYYQVQNEYVLVLTQI